MGRSGVRTVPALSRSAHTKGERKRAHVSASVYGLVFRAIIGNPTLKLVLLALADNANDNGYCYPGIDHLVRKSELSKRQVLRHLDRLEEMGLMRRQSGVGRGNNSEFWLDLDLIQEKVSPMTPIKQKVTSGTIKGAIQDTKGAICDPYKEETSETSLEPFSLSTQEPVRHSLHKQVQIYIQTVYQRKFNTPPSWDGSEAKLLKSAIEANPTWIFTTFQRLIDNRYDSDGVNGERPRTWLSDLGKYMLGPLDKYGNPISKSPVVEKRVLSANERMMRSAGVGL
jgi:DNA-binding transcriptional ArsR family regulator